ncbi:MAG: gamma carbonic anhydrase family protein, partial [Alphaproteobacteria bacterium HGW-Alphaproteobacteria-12]
MPVYALGDKKPILPAEGEYWIAPNAEVMGNVKLEN